MTTYKGTKNSQLAIDKAHEIKLYNKSSFEMGGVNFEIMDFLSCGKVESINIGDSDKMVIDLFGVPDEIESYDNAFYFHYDNYRFLFESFKLEAITVFFIKETRYPIDSKSQELHIYELTKDTKFTDFIIFLQDSNFNWQILNNEYDKDYLKIVINKKVVVIYYLYTDSIERITYHPKIDVLA